MKRFVPMSLFAGLALLLASNATAQVLVTAPLDGIVALVEEDVILRSELDRAVTQVRTQYADRPQQLPPDSVLQRQVLERLILQRLQLQRAEASGIRISDEEINQAVSAVAQQNSMSVMQLRDALQSEGMSFARFRIQLRDEITTQRLRQRIAMSRSEVSEGEIDIYLANRPADASEVRLSHIVVALPENASATEIATAQEKMDGVLKLIQEGMDFSAAAIRYSDGQQALDGGDLGWRPSDQIPSAFANEVAQLQVGQMTAPIRSPSGFHLIKLVEQRRDDQPRMVREFNARHILVKVSELVTSAEARARIDELRARIVAGEAFEDVAREHSEDDMSRAQGGDLGWFPPQAYGPLLGQLLESLRDGDLSEPFQSELGWHITQRLAERETDRSTDLVRGAAREAIRARKSEEELELFLRQMRSEAFVEMRLPS